MFNSTVGGSSAVAVPVSLGLGDVLRVNFDSVLFTSGSDVLRIDVGTTTALFTVRANLSSTPGAPGGVFVSQGGGSSTINISSLFFNGCPGGCDFIEIEPTSFFSGASSLVIDGIGVTGGFGGGPTTFIDSFLPAVSSAPEPSVWILMILAFVGVATRLKQVKRSLVRMPIYDRQSQFPLTPQV